MKQEIIQKKRKIYEQTKKFSVYETIHFKLI